MDKGVLSNIFKAQSLCLELSFEDHKAGRTPDGFRKEIDDFLACAFNAALCNIPKDDPEIKADSLKCLAGIIQYAAEINDETLAGTAYGILTIVELDADIEKLTRFRQGLHIVAGVNAKPESLNL